MKSIKIMVLTMVFFSFGMERMIAQELSVFSGFWSPEYYQDDKQITKQEAKQLIMDYNLSEPYWKKKMLNEGLFYGTYFVSLGSAFWLGSELGKDRDNASITTPTVVTLGSFVVSMIFLNSANKNAKKAILTYNSQFDGKTTTYRLVPVGNSNGLGLALKF